MCIASVVYCTLYPLYKLYFRLVCLRREILPTLDGPSTPLDTEQIDHQHQHQHQERQHIKNNVCLGRLTTSPCGISITAIPAIPRILSILKKIKRFLKQRSCDFTLAACFVEGGGYVRRTWCLQI